MVRLTHKRNNGIKTGFWSLNKKQELVDRLAAYEETGLTPENIKTISQSEDGWIPADQLPPEWEEVLVWFEYYRYGDYNCMYQKFGRGYARDGKWSSMVDDTSGWKDLRIIAWRPLPEPPQEEE